MNGRLLSKKTEVVKTTETRIAESKFRILLGGVLALGLLLLAAIQETPSSMLVVLILGCGPCCLYVAAKVGQCVRAQQMLSSKSEVGDPTALGKIVEKWRQRYDRSQEAVRKLDDRDILVARVKLAEADVSSWEFKISDAEVQIQRRISFEQQRQRKQTP
jgi:F0F1-type ATP synthase assembly protein I